MDFGPQVSLLSRLFFIIITIDLPILFQLITISKMEEAALLLSGLLIRLHFNFTLGLFATFSRLHPPTPLQSDVNSFQNVHS